MTETSHSRLLAGPPLTPASDYFDYSGRDDVRWGGVKMVPVDTPKGTYRVWTKRVGNNPRVKLLLLHGGPIADWDRTLDLPRIEVPTLTIGAAHDTMDPAHMEWMARAVRHGRYLHCPDGGHLSQFDDQEVYVAGLVRFITDVDAGRF